MYTVVVADDEPELRRSLIARTPWAECGFEVVGEAENGMEALELVEKRSPDLLLTDIRMPFLSGIALARAVREIRPAMHIAFLSGYDDFTYAQQAIQYNIISYLLKPISSAELAEELKHIREKMDRRFQEIAQGRADRLQAQEFLIPLLLGADAALPEEALEAALRAQAAECGLLDPGDPTSRFAVLAVSICDMDGRPIATRAHVHAVQLVLGKYFRSASCFVGGRVAALVTASAFDQSKYLHIAVSEIAQSIERAMHCRCTVGVSRETSALSSCHLAYRQALSALEFTAAADAGDARFIADLEPARHVQSDFSEAATQLEGLIKSGAQDEIAGFLTAQFDALRDGRHPAVEADLMVIQLLAAVCRSAGAVVDPSAAANLWASSPMAGLSVRSRSLSELQDKMIDFCSRVSEAILSQCRESGEVLCENALSIIATQFGDESLSLVSLSDRLHISPNYLSALIRKNTGETFVSLLTAKRLDTARELLTCTPLKVMEIASRCGYSDQHYFSYCFKKRFGMSPLSMRRQAGEGAGS